MTDYKRLRSLFFEINEILDNAPEEYECLDEEMMYVQTCKI